MSETAAEAAARSLLGIHANASRSNNVADKMGKNVSRSRRVIIFFIHKGFPALEGTAVGGSNRFEKKKNIHQTDSCPDR